MTNSSKIFVKILVFLFIVVAVSSFLRTIWTSYQALQNVKQEEHNVQLIEAETETLREQVEEATSSFELERRARENLHLQMPGETIIRIDR